MSSRDRAYIESLYPDVVAEITAEVRERIAADIEAACVRGQYHLYDDGERKPCDACLDAARIARGQA